MPEILSICLESDSKLDMGLQRKKKKKRKGKKKKNSKRKEIQLSR